MGKYRRDRINEEMMREIGEIVRNVKDPRVSQHFITVIRADVTPDLKYAKIFYSVMDADSEDFDEKELRQGLKSASAYIRGQIAQRLNLRITPELNFVYDPSIAYGAKINQILHTPGVQDDIRRFDERAAQEAAEALAAAQAAEENAAEGSGDAADGAAVSGAETAGAEKRTEDDEYDD